jgi:DNA-binding NarL/FixJ family response regulator
VDRCPIKVLVVDDHEVVRSGLASILAREPDLDLVGALARAEDALAALDDLAPDVIVLDYRLDGMSGAIACSEIVAIRPSTKVLILTTSVENAVLVCCLAAGARGFLLKNADVAELVNGIRAVAAGGYAVAPEASEALARMIHQSQLVTPADQLSPQEMTALSLSAQGWKNEEIARYLKITTGVLRTGLSGARRKLGARERSEAVLVGIRRGLI